MKQNYRPPEMTFFELDFKDIITVSDDNLLEWDTTDSQNIRIN